MIRSAIHYKLHLLVVVLLLVCFTQSASALDVPALKGRVNDYGNILSDWSTTQLNTILADLEKTDSTQIAALTIPSLEGDSLEGFSLKVVEKWQIGQKGLDNGALLLIARDDRKIRIEVGYGLEGKLTDLVSGQIIRNVITPEFRNGNFDQGVINGIGSMISATKGEFKATQSPQSSDDPDLGGVLTVMIFIFFFFGSMFRKSKIFAALVGGVATPLSGFLFFGITGSLFFLLIPVGVIGGLIASLLASASGSGVSSGTGGFYGGSSSGFGGSSGGFGGFSGGGGGFGGGGASGGW